MDQKKQLINLLVLLEDAAADSQFQVSGLK